MADHDQANTTEEIVEMCENLLQGARIVLVKERTHSNLAKSLLITLICLPIAFELTNASVFYAAIGACSLKILGSMALTVRYAHDVLSYELSPFQKRELAAIIGMEETNLRNLSELSKAAMTTVTAMYLKREWNYTYLTYDYRLRISMYIFGYYF